MQLSKFTDYGLRVLMHLAACHPLRVSVTQIAASFDISEHHVAKVASALVKGGFVISGRGRTGGLVLATPADHINIGAVVRHLTGDVPVAECFAKDGADCAAFAQCGLRGPLQRAQQAFYEVLDNYTLKQVVKDQKLMAALLA
ncbi:Rrf2 family transcriptional regulator [Amylibacter marinus]|uniref:Rrf2 family transcriptional regulator n=1 Tax=Amylibacter marinus TaxID=1475483 RepID=A0ABQ5VXS9_9RHOB|nr:Rrf2 family transcriptional regulator [Amylibacter marinus]GLQ36099.1 Rrf2 family transcriptional regulator [Amylibacter marinus]